MLGKERIEELVDAGVIEGAVKDRVGQIAYDLTTKEFYTSKEGTVTSVALAPGDSTYVGAAECIRLPNSLSCRVILKNSRMRQGLSLDAPVYFPTHKTRVFFRVTNLSSSIIRLSSEDQLAAIVFDTIEGNIGKPYDGAFADEFDYSGMGNYSDIYKREIQEIESVADDIKAVEKRMYGNVMTLMAIFVSVFTLVNVNLVGGFSGISSLGLITLNLSSIGSFAALFAAVAVILDKKKPKAIALSGVSLIAFIAAVVVYVCCGGLL